MALQDDAPDFSRPGSDLHEFQAEASCLLKAAATLCYLFWATSYSFRLVLAAVALTNSMQVGRGDQPICHAPPPASANTSVAHATTAYYSLMVFIASFYLGIIELWGWWWTLVSMRKKIIGLGLALNNHRTGDVPPEDELKNEERGSILTYTHQCALRYAYYMYFKCDNMSVSWMLANKRTWREGPTCNAIVLPWPWVDAVLWLHGQDPAAAVATSLAFEELLIVLPAVLVLSAPMLGLLLLLAWLLGNKLIPGRDTSSDRRPKVPNDIATVPQSTGRRRIQAQRKKTKAC